MPIIGVINEKGGVGKTTTVINLAAALAKQHKVLLVDLDPQANASSGLGLILPENTTYEVLKGEISARQAIVDSDIKNLKILPASAELAGANVDIKSTAENMRILSKALIAVRPQFDFIILDSPPSKGALTINAMVAADKLLIPLQTEYYALEGIASVVDTIKRVRASLNPKLDIIGILLTMFDVRTNLSQQVEENVREHFGDMVFRTIIPRSIRLAEAPSYSQSIFEFAPSSSGALAYKQLAKEVIKRAREA